MVSLRKVFQKRDIDFKDLSSINKFLEIHLYIFSIDKRIILFKS